MHEVESLYVLKPVYLAVATHLGLAAGAEQTYAATHQVWKRQMSGILSNKLICERFKARSMMLLERGFIAAVDFNDRDALQNAMTKQIPTTLPVIHPDQIWNEEATIVDGAVDSNESTVFLRVLPGKPLVGPAATSLGITKERYCEIIKIGLASSDAGFATLHASLEAALAPYLPARHVT